MDLIGPKEDLEKEMDEKKITETKRRSISGLVGGVMGGGGLGIDWDDDFRSDVKENANDFKDFFDTALFAEEYEYLIYFNILGAGIAQSVEALYFTTELHTSSVRVRVQPGEKKPSECMSFGCRIPVAVVSQAYPGNAEICPGFPPQAALHIILSNEGDAVYRYR